MHYILTVKDEYRALTLAVGSLDEFLWRFDGTPMKAAVDGR